MKRILIFIRVILSAIALVIFLSGCKKDEKESVVIERGTVTDHEGNVYVTVQIGDQWWMAENLKTRSFLDGSPVLEIAITDPDIDWANANIPAYTSINDPLFGLLYNHMVVTSDKKIAPQGWHIPTDEDWLKLESAIGMTESDLHRTGWRGETEGEKLTSLNSKGWPEGGVLFGTDEFGFNALPGSCRIFDGRTNLGSNTAFWWTTSTQTDEVCYRYIDLFEKRIFRQYTSPKYGMSIRCVKD